MKNSEAGLDPAQRRDRYLAAEAAHAETDEHPAILAPSLWERVCAWMHRIRVRRALRRQYRDPEGRALWYNGTGVLLYVAGMMVAAVALRGMGAI